MTDPMVSAFVLQGTLREYLVLADNLIELLKLIHGDCDTDAFGRLPKKLREDIRQLLEDDLPSSEYIEDGLDSAKFFYNHAEDINTCLMRVKECYRNKEQ